MLRNATVQISMELWGAIICLIFASFLGISEERRSRRSHLMIALLLQVFTLLVSDSAAWLFRGVDTPLGYYAVRISNYLVFVMNYFMGVTSILYMDALLQLQGSRVALPIRLGVYSLCLTGEVMVTVSQFTGFLYTFDAHNVYSRSSGYWSLAVLAAMVTVMLIACILYYSRQVPRVQSVPLLLVYLLTLLADCIQMVFYGISLVNIAMTAGVLILFFAFEKELVQVSAERQNKLLEKSLRLMQQEAEMARKDAEMATIHSQLVEKQTQIMLSQIQPHFLYNALSAISFLCIKDPMKAKETLDHFAFYLRSNLNSLRSEHLVPFYQELAHTKAYLAIEQTRFGEDLEIEYQIEAEGFMLPSLSLQPLAENAVRHGICGKEEGGKVTVRTERKDGFIYITVTDNGVGFDPGQPPQDGRSHVGMENVTQRVQALCNGRVEITSAVGRGTTAAIILPIIPD